MSIESILTDIRSALAAHPLAADFAEQIDELDTALVRVQIQERCFAEAKASRDLAVSELDRIRCKLREALADG